MFRKALHNAIDDGVISEDEELHLKKIKEIIIETAQKIAEEDGTISNEEMDLILTVVVALKVPRSD